MTGDAERSAAARRGVETPDRPEPRLVLWDIDHTLIHLGGVGLDACAAAFARATGRPWNRTFVVPGLPERAMIAAAFRFHGLEADPASQAAFLDYGVEEHPARAEQLVRRGGVLPGAAEALAALAATHGERYHRVRTVLTGDTVRDVRAALANGVGIVAVASGTTPAAGLREAGADIVLADLADTERLLTAVDRAARIAAVR